MTITVHPHGLDVEDPPLGLVSVLQVKHPAEEHIKRRNPHMSSWDGVVKFWSRGEGTLIRCGRGFLSRITEWATKNDVGFVVEYAFTRPAMPGYSLAIDGDLDDEQRGPCEALLSNDFCLLELKTGSGKTVILCNAIGAMLESYPTARAVFVVPKRSLMVQTAKSFEKFLPNCKVGLIGDGEFTCDEDTSVAIAVVNSAAAQDHHVNARAVTDWLNGVDIVMLDECHRSSSDTWKTALKNCPNATVVWAVSGKVSFSDPLKSLGIEAAVGRPIVRGGNESRQCPVEVITYANRSWAKDLDDMGLQSSLVDNCGVVVHIGDNVLEANWRGSSQDGKIPSWIRDRAKAISKATKVKVKLSDCFGVYFKRTLLSEPRDGTYGPYIERDQMVFATAQDFGIVDYGKRNRWAAELAQKFTASGEPWVISVRRNRHVTLISRMLEKLSVEHGVIQGGMSGAKQGRVFDAIKDRRLPGLVGNVDMIGEGVDIPNLVHIIRLDGMTGESVLEQTKGRVQRVHPDKVKGYVHIPLDPHLEKLESNARKMVTYYRKTGLKVTAML